MFIEATDYILKRNHHKNIVNIKKAVEDVCGSDDESSQILFQMFQRENPFFKEWKCYLVYIEIWY